MLIEHPDRHRLYFPHDWIMSIQLGEMANGLNLYKYASYWMLRGFELFKIEGDQSKFSAFLLPIIPYLISDKRFATAIHLSIEAIKWTIACQKNSGTGNLREMSNADVDIEIIFGDKSNDDWSKVEERVANLCILPIIVYLSFEGLNGNTSLSQYIQDALAICK